MVELKSQIFRFAIIGGLATLAHVGVAVILHEFFGFGPMAANFMAFCSAWSVSYLGNYLWTFDAKSQHRNSVPRFAISSLSALMINQLIVYLVTDTLGFSLRWALIPVVLIVPAFSFVASRIWVFKDQPGKSAHRLKPDIS